MRLRKILGKIKRRILGQPEPETYLEMAIRFGLKIGKNVSIENEVNLDLSHCWLISIGDDCTLAPRVQVLAHDASTKRHLGYTKIGRVNNGHKTFIGAGSIILPGVTIGNNVVIGAGSVISKDIPSGMVVAGNPAKIIGTINDYIKKHQTKMNDRPTFRHHGLLPDEFIKNGGIPKEEKELQKNLLVNGIGYIE